MVWIVSMTRNVIYKCQYSTFIKILITFMCTLINISQSYWMTGSLNTDILCKKGQSRLFFLQRQRSLGVWWDAAWSHRGGLFYPAVCIYLSMHFHFLYLKGKRAEYDKLDFYRTFFTMTAEHSHDNNVNLLKICSDGKLFKCAHFPKYCCWIQ